MPKLTNEDLISILRKEEQVGQQWGEARLEGAHTKSLAYYDRDASYPDFGSEPGQSSAITSEVADTVETVMPGLMRVLVNGDEIGTFTPIEEQDEQWAKEASGYVPHVLMRENDGFRIHYWFCKDVLMYPIGAMTVDVEEVEKTRRENVQGATEEMMALFEEQAKEQGATEVVWEVEEDSGEVGQVPTVLAPSAEGPGDMGLPAPTFSGIVTVTRKKKVVRVDNIAPGDLRISPADCRDIDRASYAGYVKQVTASDLRMLGLRQSVIDEISSDKRSTPEEDQRQQGEGYTQPRQDDQRRFWLCVAYVRADDDGDGISEMLRVVYAHAGGDAGAIIERVKWEEEEAPIIIGSAVLMPHTLVGRSMFDQTADLQDIGTQITRGVLDNIYLQNRPRPAINARVNINSVLDHTPLMPITVNGNENPANAISWLQVPNLIDSGLSVLGYLENKRDQRAGTNRMGNNMDSDALQDASRMTASGTSALMSVAQERQELIVNTLAQTAFTRLYRHVYRAIKRCESGPTKYHAKGDWQQCNPAMWPDDMHLIVNVGTTNKQMEQQALTMIGGAQEKLWLAQGGANGPLTIEHLMNTGRKLSESLGYRSTAMFFPSDKDVKQALQKQAMTPPPPSPAMAKVQADAAAQQAKMQADSALAAAKLQAETQHKQAQAAIDIQLQREKAAADLQIAREKAALDMQIAREKAALEAQLKARELDQEAVLGAMEIKANAEVQGAAQQREKEV